MTDTEVELQLCGDCTLVIANDDDSGSEDPEAVRAGLAAHWPGYRLVITWASDDVNGFGSLEGEECDGCRRVELLRARGLAIPF